MHPDPGTAAEVRTPITFVRNGLTARPRPAVLFLHGYGSDRSSYTERAETVSAVLNISCLTFDLRGHGRNPGERASLTLRDHLADALAAYDQLISFDGVDPSRVGVCGASYGAYLACLLAAHRTVTRALLRAPALYEDADFDVPPHRRTGVQDVARTARLADGAAGISGDILILESSADEVIPHKVIERYLALSPRTHHAVIHGATHQLTDAAWRSSFLHHITEWFGGL